MVDNKTIKRPSFIFELGAVADDKDKLLELARGAIAESHDHRTFAERKDLIKNADCLDINARRALLKAMTSTNLSTNNKLYLIMERYVELEEKKHPKASRAKALDKFFEEFAAKYPQEFGIDGAEKRQVRGVPAGNYVMQRDSGNGIV